MKSRAGWGPPVESLRIHQFVQRSTFGGRKIGGVSIGRGKTGAERGSLAEFRANLACLETVAQAGSDPVESGVLVRSGFLLS